jgi:anti-anti-sigma factor
VTEPEPLARLDVERSDGAVHVTVTGEIDISNSEEIERELRNATEGAASVVVDLHLVAYIDSGGVRLLHHLARRLAETGASLRVVAPAGTIAASVLRLTQLPGLETDGG